MSGGAILEVGCERKMVWHEARCNIVGKSGREIWKRNQGTTAFENYRYVQVKLTRWKIETVRFYDLSWAQIDITFKIFFSESFFIPSFLWLAPTQYCTVFPSRVSCFGSQYDGRLVFNRIPYLWRDDEEQRQTSGRRNSVMYKYGLIHKSSHIRWRCAVSRKSYVS